MTRITGQRQFTVPVVVLWSQLTDLSFVVSALPDVTKVNSISDNSAAVVIRPKLSFVQTELDLTIEQSVDEPNRSADWILNTRAIGSTSRVRAKMQLSPSDSGSTLNWSADVEQLGGLLKLVPSALIQATAQKVINDILSAVSDKLNSESV